MSAYSDTLLPTSSAHNTNLNHYLDIGLHPQISLVDVSHPSSPSQLDMTHRGSSGELMNDDEEKPLIQQELAPVRTADGEFKLAADPGSSSPPSDPQRVQPCVSRLSLFTGMELVTKGRNLCERPLSERGTSLKVTHPLNNILYETQPAHISDSPEDSSVLCISKTNEEASSTCNSAMSVSSQPVSAFSFLNV